ncbi:MAG: phytoene/squalene synthase family protein, partial [Chloroflexota bacterium]
MPLSIKRDVEDLYAFCRTLDNLVDSPPPGLDPNGVRGKLAAWHEWLRESPLPPGDCPAADALRSVICKYRVPQRHLVDLIEGCRTDLAQPRFEEFAELERYCYQVGSTVGLAMCPILGVTHPRALECARSLGIAMQLTNVLRDVGEDAAL